MTIRRLWVPLLVALLVGGLVGPAGGAVTATEPRVTTVSIMISASDFIPTADDVDYKNAGVNAFVLSGIGTFTKGLDFPVGVVSIKRITLYALDDDPGAYVCVTLYRARPPEADETLAGQVCTTDASAPQSPYTTVISPRQVATAFQHAYLWATISAPGVSFYGVKVTYSY